jgi:hypothetical protein
MEFLPGFITRKNNNRKHIKEKKCWQDQEIGRTDS